MTVDFETRYRLQPDPWGYATSAYEQGKYAVTLAACGHGPFEHALELGGSIGVFTRLLAPRCRRLTSLDGAPTAVLAARARTAEHPHVDARVGTIPADLPDAGRFDLVVASEVLYYLDGHLLDDALSRVCAGLPPGARVVAVHWRTPGPERPLTADAVHARLRGTATLRPLAMVRHDSYLLDVLEAR